MASNQEAPALPSMGLSLKSRNRKRGDDEWETHKPFIIEHYSSKGITLKAIERMLHEKGFLVSERQLKRKIADWKIDKKVKGPEMKVIAKRRQQRKAEGKSTSFRVRHQPVNDEKIDRWLKKEGLYDSLVISNISAGSPASSASTPSAISYNTLSQIGSPSPTPRSNELLARDVSTRLTSTQTVTEQITGISLSQSVSVLHVDEEDGLGQTDSRPESFGSYLETIDSDFAGQSPAPFTAPPTPEPTHTRPDLSQPVVGLQSSNSTQNQLRLDQTLTADPASNIRKTRYREEEEMKFQQRLHELIDRHGPHHPAALDTLGRLVRVYHDQGRLNRAEKECKQLIERCTIAFGDGDPRVLINSSVLAMIFWSQGRSSESLALSREIHNKASANLAPPHQVLLEVKSDLAITLCVFGDHAEAELLLRDSLMISRLARRLDDEFVLILMGKLAWVLKLSGKYDESQKIYEEVILARTLSQPHIYGLLSCKHNLGDILMKKGKYLEAGAMLTEVCDGFTKLLGPEHPTTLNSCSAHATNLVNQCQYYEGQNILEDVITKMTKISGPSHPDTVHSKCNLVYALTWQRQYNEAEALGREILTLAEEAFGFDNILTIQCVAVLGAVYSGQGRFEKALELYGRALRVATDRFGTEHMQVKRLSSAYRAVLQQKEQAEDISAVLGTIEWNAMENMTWMEEILPETEMLG